MFRHLFQKHKVVSAVPADIRYLDSTISLNDPRIIKKSDIVPKIIDTINSIKKDPDSANVIVIDSIPQ